MGASGAGRLPRPSRYVRKTRDAWAIEVNYGAGDGWEHECTEFSWRETREQLKAYRENCPYPVRARKFRERIAEEEEQPR